jgi:anion-transporting  ArsA/GET3 family ATPase
MREEALERWQLLQDRSQHLVLPVTLAEEMAVTETIELLERLDAMGLGADDVLVNKMLPPLFEPGDKELLEGLHLDGAVAEAIDAGRYRASWQKVQTDQLARLRAHVAQRAVMIPHMLVSAMGPETIEALSLALEALLAPLPTTTAAA